MGKAEEDPPATSWGSDLQPPAPPAPRLSWSAPLKTPLGMEEMVPYTGDVWVIGTGVGNVAINVCPLRMEGLGPEEELPSSARCPRIIGGGSSLPWQTRWCGSPSPPAASTLGFGPSCAVLTHATGDSAMHWASMAMHYTASLPSMQGEWDGKVKYDNKKKEYKCPCPEKVCNYPLFARVKGIIYASAIRMARMQNRSFTHANWCIYVVA